MSQERTPVSRQIVLSSREELRRWCLQLACSEAELLHAVWKAGPDATKVQAFLDEELAARLSADRSAANTH
jgi:hypothetical protein